MHIKVGLLGFGRTGSVVAEEIIKDKDLDLQWVIRRSNKNDGEYASRLLGFNHDEGKLFSIQNIDHNTFFNYYKVDVIIDFSNHGSVHEYIFAANNHTRIVSAISKYSDEEFEILRKISKKTAVLYSPNITLGVNFLIEVSKMLQKIAPNADIAIVEEHFTEKKSVSGTALKIAGELGLDNDSQINSIRAGGIVGTHEVIFGLPYQTIRIKHESLNRAAFGQGAIYAAKWLMHRERNMYTMEDAIAFPFLQTPEYLCG